MRDRSGAFPPLGEPARDGAETDSGRASSATITRPVRGLDAVADSAPRTIAGRLRSRFRDWGGRVVLLCLDPFLGLSLPGFLDPESALIVTLDESPALDELRDRGFEVLRVDAEMVASRSSAALLAAPAVQARLLELAVEGPVGLLSFKPSHQLVKAVRELDAKAPEFARGRLALFAGSPKVARRFENKHRFPKLIAARGVPLPESRTIRPADDSDYASLTAALGRPFVAQTAAGFSGAGTTLIASREDWAALVAERPGRPLKVVRLVEGRAVTVNACVLRDGATVCGPLVEQLTGHATLTPHRLGSCGNRWGLPELEVHRAEAARIAGEVGAALHAEGYIGHFGLDLILSEDEGAARMTVIECNPRLTAPLPISTALSLERGEAPLLALHLLAHAGLEDEDLRERAPEITELTQLILRHQGPAREDQPRPWSLATTEALRRPGTFRDFFGAVFSKAGSELRSLDIELGGRRRVKEGQEIARRLIRGGLSPWSLEGEIQRFAADR